MDVDEVSMDGDTLKMIIRDCELRKPDEACGVLVGNLREKTADVSEAIPMSNQLSSSKKFVISPNELYHVWMDMENKGKQILGAYHSHPGGDASPSLNDETSMKDTSFVWLIIGASDNVHAFIYKGELKEIPIKQKATQKY